MTPTIKDSFSPIEGLEVTFVENYKFFKGMAKLSHREPTEQELDKLRGVYDNLSVLEMAIFETRLMLSDVLELNNEDEEQL